MSSATDTRKRVKLYILNEQRQWDDKGTGHVSSICNDKIRTVTLNVKSEIDGSALLESRILPHTAYQKQQETLIVWSEGDRRDLALSFQEKAGCDEIWEKICEVQGKDPSITITRETHDESDEDQLDTVDNSPLSDLPACELSKLKDIRDLFNELSRKSSSYKEKFTTILENDGYIKKLIDLFHMCEDLENMEGLNYLYEIFRNIFYLNRSSLFDILLSEDLIMDVIGCLEYDPAKVEQIKHREFINTKSQFKEVIPFNNAELVSKIHQTYRIQYIQDVILPAPSVFEENSLACLSSFVFLNKVEISNLIQEDERFLKELFENLKSPNIDDKKRCDMFQFLREFITFSHGLQQTRESLYKLLYDQGILSVLKVALNSDDDKVKTIGIEIFSHFVEAASTMVREYILNEPDNTKSVTRQSSNNENNSNNNSEEMIDNSLLNLVIKYMINDPDQELSGAMQIVNLLKLLTDPENMLSAVNKAEKSEFLAHFYKKNISVLLAPLFNNTVDNRISRDDYRVAQLQNLILDFLSFCVEHHTYHIKNYIIHKDLLKRILVLLKSKHQFLALSALRFLRKTISLKEETYYKHIVKSNLFEPVIESLRTNGSRYNILNSAIVELFDFIRSDDIKSLINYVIENFHETVLQNITYVRTFKELKLRYDQSRDRLSDVSIKSKLSSEGTPQLYRTSTSSNERFRADRLEFDKDEDAWIEEDDDEFENNNQRNEMNLQQQQQPGVTNNSFNEEQENNLDAFIELKKSSSSPATADEESVFPPVKSILNISNTSNVKPHLTISINIKSNLSSIISTSSSNGVQSTSPTSNNTSSSSSSSSSSSPISSPTSTTPFTNLLQSTNTQHQKSPTYSRSPTDTSELVNGGTHNTSLPTPSNSPMSVKKFPLVDYDDDSDEDENNSDNHTHQHNSTTTTHVNNTNVKLFKNTNNNNNDHNSNNNEIIDNDTNIIKDTIINTTTTITDLQLNSPQSPQNPIEPATKRARLSNSNS